MSTTVARFVFASSPNRSTGSAYADTERTSRAKWPNPNPKRYTPSEPTGAENLLRTASKGLDRLFATPNATPERSELLTL